ncbi:unnamed protein product, partial [Candidula unifasciata]
MICLLFLGVLTFAAGDSPDNGTVSITTTAESTVFKIIVDLCLSLGGLDSNETISFMMNITDQ